MRANQIRLGDHFTYGKLLRFTLSPMLMMLFTSIYWIVDGFFISNYIGTSEFAGVNLIFPVVMSVACLGFMFGAGGSALVAKRLGEGDVEKANKTFSLITYSTFVIGIIASVSIFFLVRPIAYAFASINAVETTQEMIDAAELYGRIMIGGVFIYIMQVFFHPFFSVNETNFHGFLFTLISGLTNMLLDYLLIGVLDFGVVGAASASLTGMFISSVGPIIYFRFRKNNLIRLGKPNFQIKDILKSATNGVSEFVSNVSGSIVTIVFNIQLLKYIGENGVSAYGIIAYVCFVFFAIFIGYSMGSAPIISYNYGAKNTEELTNVLRRSLILMSIFGLAMTVLGILLSEPFTYVFANQNPELNALTSRAMKIYSVCYILVGFSMFGSSFFTALNNGVISAIISFCRTLVFQLGAVFIFPLFMGVDGIWVSIIFAELGSMIMTLIFMYTKRKKYGYEIKVFNLRKVKNEDSE